MVWPHANMRPYGQTIADEVAENLEITPKTFFYAPEFYTYGMATCEHEALRTAYCR